jgi:hypothetical protein
MKVEEVGPGKGPNTVIIAIKFPRVLEGTFIKDTDEQPDKEVRKAGKEGT